MKKVAVLGIIILSVSIGLVFGSMDKKLGSADTAITPQVCQYPDRLSNPPGGCDNSDPACGEIAKGAATCSGETNVLLPQVSAPVDTPSVCKN